MALPILSVPILILNVRLILSVPIASLPILTASLIARVPDGPAQTWRGRDPIAHVDWELPGSCMRFSSLNFPRHARI